MFFKALMFWNASFFIHWSLFGLRCCPGLYKKFQRQFSVQKDFRAVVGMSYSVSVTSPYYLSAQILVNEMCSSSFLTASVSSKEVVAEPCHAIAACGADFFLTPRSAVLLVQLTSHGDFFYWKAAGKYQVDLSVN